MMYKRFSALSSVRRRLAWILVPTAIVFGGCSVMELLPHRTSPRTGTSGEPSHSAASVVSAVITEPVIGPTVAACAPAPCLPQIDFPTPEIVPPTAMVSAPASLAPIPYADLPTGGGTWANGGTLSITGGTVSINGNSTLPLDLVVGTATSGTLRLADVTTNSTTKLGGILGRHYTNAEEEVMGMLISSTSTENRVYMGGGSSSRNAASQFVVFTAANNTTLTGTARLIVNSSGGATFGSTDLTGANPVYMGALTASTGTFSGDVVTSSDDIAVGSGVTTANQNGQVKIVAGTNAGANNKDSYISHFRGSSELWRQGVLGSLAANGNWTLRDVANSASPLMVQAATGKIFVAERMVIGTDTGGSYRLRVNDSLRVGNLAVATNVDGQPAFSPTDSLKQFTAGDRTLGGYILMNGVGYGTEKGNVLITGRTTGGAGDVKIRSYNGTSTTDNAVFKADGTWIAGTDPGSGGKLRIGTTSDGNVLVTGRTGGTNAPVFGINHNESTVVTQLIASSSNGAPSMHLVVGAGTVAKLANGIQVGAPAGGDKGTGSINVAADIWKNGTAYNHPDYVFDVVYDGMTANPAGAAYAPMSLEEVERFTRQYHRLPGISTEASGIFERADMLLEKVEELYLHAIAQEKELRALKEQNARLARRLENQGVAEGGVR